jgi:hypothetical protein
MDRVVQQLNDDEPEIVAATIADINKDIALMQSEIRKEKKDSDKKVAEGKAKLKEAIKIAGQMARKTQNVGASGILEDEISQASSDFDGSTGSTDSVIKTEDDNVPADGEPSEGPSDDNSDDSDSTYDSEDSDAARKTQRELRRIKTELKRMKGHCKRSKSSYRTLSSKRDPTKRTAKLTAKLQKACYTSKLKMLRMDENPLQKRVNFNNFCTSFGIILSQFVQTSSVFDHQYQLQEGAEVHDYVSSALYNVLYGYVDAACQKLMMEHLGDGIESLKCLKQQCAIITFADKQRFDQIFRQCGHRTGETTNGYMKRFHAAKSLATSVDNH